MIIIALSVITGLMATGAIQGYAGPWTWAVFGLSIAMLVSSLLD